MTYILSTIFFIFGLVIGSFLNVVIFRLNTQTFFSRRSICMSCSKQLSWYELIPILSFLFLRGRCSTCQHRISRQYPLVESITGLIFLGLLLKFENILYSSLPGFIISYGYYATIFSIFIVIIFYDIRHKIIPDILSLALVIITFLGLFLFKDFNFYLHFPSWLDFVSGLALSLPLAFLWLVSKGTWIGLGDAKLAVSLGWLLGITRILNGTLIAFWSGAVVGIFLMVPFWKEKYSIKSEIPFAPFLIFGTLIAFFFEFGFLPYYF
jgi:leader peptidase (prepilin peptidase)/N-methyltransferase